MRQIVIAYLALAAVTPLLAADVYVSNSGNDDNPGTRQKPFASLQKALAAVRDAGPGTIWLAEAEYYVGNRARCAPYMLRIHPAAPRRPARSSFLLLLRASVLQPALLPPDCTTETRRTRKTSSMLFGGAR